MSQNKVSTGDGIKDLIRRIQALEQRVTKLEASRKVNS